MPPPSNDPKGSKSKKPARRRKKKSRTEVSESDSSSSSSSSSNSEDEGMKDVEGDMDVTMMGVIDDEAEKSSSGSEDEEGKKRKKKDIEDLTGHKFVDALWASDWKDLDKFPEEVPRRFPEGIEKFRDPVMDEGLVAAKFEEYYMKCITTEFGEDLDKLRTAKDFDDDSIPMLLRLLKRGVNIFDEEEKQKVVVDERKRWEEEEEKQRAKEEIERETAVESGRTYS